MAFAGCGAKSNEDIAKDLIREKLKTSLPDFNGYESVNFGTMGTAFLPYEETDLNLSNMKAINDCKDSIAVLEKLIGENKNASPADASFRKKMQQFQDSVTAKSERNNTAKQGYTPEKLFKITHAYTLKDKSGIEKKTEEEFYLDKDLKKVVKVHKVY